MGEWIRVEERLPKEGIMVLVGGAWPGVFVAYQFSQEWLSRDLTPVVPTHWQPLPNPPEDPGPFCVDSQRRGDLITVRHRDEGWICTVDTQLVGERLRDKLNDLWRKSQGVYDTYSIRYRLILDGKPTNIELIGVDEKDAYRMLRGEWSLAHLGWPPSPIPSLDRCCLEYIDRELRSRSTEG